MVFNPSIPQPSDQLLTSQAQLLGNFQELLTWSGIDHLLLNDPNQGKHGLIHFIIRTAGSTSATEIGLGSKDVSGTPQLFYWPASTAFGSARQITGVTTASTNGTTTNIDGLITKWGNSAVVDGSNVVTFSTAFPTNCFCVVVTPEVASPLAAPTWRITTKVAASFTLRANVSFTANWIAIGN